MQHCISANQTGRWLTYNFIFLVTYACIFTNIVITPQCTLKQVLQHKLYGREINKLKVQQITTSCINSAVDL